MSFELEELPVPRPKRRTRTTAHEVIHASGSNEWYTRASLVALAREAMGGIDLDPASCAAANARLRIPRIFTKADDGLSQRWWGRVWLNPPYGLTDKQASNQGLWSRALAERYQAGEIEQGCLLVNASTGAGWWAPLWERPICFLAKRESFWRPDGEKNSPTHYNAVIYFGERTERFAQVFEAHGRVVLPSQVRYQPQQSALFER